MTLLRLTAQLWNLFDEWEIRLLVLLSLFLQIVLIFSADHRKRNVNRALNFVLWLAYLLADSVAIFALGVLTHSQDDDSSPSPSPSPAAEKEFSLQAFWSPFLLLHLGGPDTITSFSLEDNELWRRHLLNLLFQVATAFYVFYKSLFLSTAWLLPSLFMFATGLLKYGERTWALFSASMNRFRSSLRTPPGHGAYGDIMKYNSLYAKITVQAERLLKSITPDDTQEGRSYGDPRYIVIWAYGFFLTFRRLIVDLILTYKDRLNSQDFFLTGLSTKEAFKVVEIELSFIYDVLHTKSAVIHTTIGRLIRLTTFICTIIALLLFFLIDKNKYNPMDVRVTYTLAIGALVLEIYAMFYAIVSFWTFNSLFDSNYITLSSFVFRLSNVFGMYSKPSWSDSMAGYNLLSFCYNDQFRVRLGKILCFIGLKDAWDQFWYTTHKTVPEDLKKVIFKELKLKTSSMITDTANYKLFNACPGEWALRQKGYYKELGWSVEVEFDECVLLWHIATDLCFFKETEKEKDNINISRVVSDYLLYLLLEQPFMLPVGIGQISSINQTKTNKLEESLITPGKFATVGDTCAEVKRFFQNCGKRESIEIACEMILTTETRFWPIEVKVDRSKSVLLDACRLAKELMKIEEKNTRWEVISLVLVEILCFAANKCRGNFHAKQLSYGGELLTHVWLLMAHLGIR